MPVKRSTSSRSFQQRQALRRILNQPGIGGVRRIGPQANVQRVIRKLQQREAQQLSQIGIPSQITLNNEEIQIEERITSGRATFGDFTKTKTYQDIINEYGGNIGQDIATYVYFDYQLSSTPDLTQRERKDLLLQRASALSLASKKLKIQQKERLLGAAGELRGRGITTTIKTKAGERVSLFPSSLGQLFRVDYPTKSSSSLSFAQLRLFRAAQTNSRLRRAIEMDPNLFMRLR